MWRLGKEEKLRLSSVPFKPKFDRFRRVTPNSKSSQVIPTQLMHGRSPTHEDRRDLFWLSRLAFQFRRASASLNALPTSAVAVTEEVVEEAKVAKWSKETNKSTRLQNKTLNAMTLVAVCVTEGVSEHPFQITINIKKFS